MTDSRRKVDGHNPAGSFSLFPMAFTLRGCECGWTIPTGSADPEQDQALHAALASSPSQGMRWVHVGERWGDFRRKCTAGRVLRFKDRVTPVLVGDLRSVGVEYESEGCAIEDDDIVVAYLDLSTVIADALVRAAT